MRDASRVIPARRRMMRKGSFTAQSPDDLDSSSWPARSAAPHRGVQVSVTWSICGDIAVRVVGRRFYRRDSDFIDGARHDAHAVVAHLLTGSLPQSSQASCRRLGVRTNHHKTECASTKRHASIACCNSCLPASSVVANLASLSVLRNV